MVRLEDFKKIIGDKNEITKLDMYMFMQMDEVEHLDISPDQMFSEISCFWHCFDKEEKIEILGELIKLYQTASNSSK